MKLKTIAVICTAMLAAEAILPVTAAAVSGTDVRHLAKSLTGAGDLIAADDFDGSKSVNAIDLTLMKRALMQTDSIE